MTHRIQMYISYSSIFNYPQMSSKQSNLPFNSHTNSLHNNKQSLFRYFDVQHREPCLHEWTTLTYTTLHYLIDSVLTVIESETQILHCCYTILAIIDGSHYFYDMGDLLFCCLIGWFRNSEIHHREIELDVCALLILLIIMKCFVIS